MGRVERRRKERQERKQKNKNEDAYIENKTNFKAGLITICVIILLLVALYFIMAIFVTKEINLSNKEEKTEESTSDDNASSVSNRILASSIFNQSESVYYVYFYDFNEEDSDISESVDKLSDTVYKVDTSNGLNNKYITEDSSNRNAKNLNDLKVKNPTLIKIENDTIVKYLEGNEIKSYK